ncbi:hypothetical protein LOC68_24720 [Blastopirellula sp. JC732]|uniref:Uncharacterized protein n=1 Tax=Blastopirellula sediminis TaxID=2894196 RepID=A0A9X1MQQ1_9BACT|nr:hypothetical protein [Blastopirellula sediminis]MCC9605087.1 hypothetical protein [Blastopirellula sediminis]MCC9631613.1 hypothetical protein [Blastopirellula sediminis]
MMFRPIAIAACTLLLFTSCKPVALNGDLTQQVTDAIEAINEFNRVADGAPEEVQAAADHMIDKLKIEGAEFLSHDARYFADHTLISHGAVAKGFVAYADARLKAYLDALKTALEEALPKIQAEKSRDKAIQLLRNLKIDVRPLDPFVDLVNPNRIKLNELHTYSGELAAVKYESPRIVEISGFGLLRPDDETIEYRVEVVGAEESRFLPPVIVSESSPFTLLINLSHFQPAEGDQKMLVWWGSRKLADIPFETLIETEAAPVPQPRKPAPPENVAGVLFDSSDGKVTYVIEHTGKTDETNIVIRRADEAIGWKKLIVKNGDGEISAVETSKDDDGREIKLTTGNLVGDLKLAFGTSGTFTFWKGIHEVPTTKESLLGKRITYTWERE